MRFPKQSEINYGSIPVADGSAPTEQVTNTFKQHVYYFIFRSNL